jgi:GMP synthase-like glutamine amidotransferase
MKPILVLQHLIDDGPAFLGTWLWRQGLRVDLRCTERGDSFPRTLSGHSALAILGGSMSANDDMPSLRQAEALVRQGLSSGTPVIGHCLGGQLMARAMGARIGPSPAPEVGWQRIRCEPVTLARDWLGDAAAATVFQWHYEAFELPSGAVALAGSAACPVQAFAIGPHLAMQFHVEIDDQKLGHWVTHLDAGYLPARLSHPGSVQSVEAMLDDAGRNGTAHRALADRIYRRWLLAAGFDLAM